MALDKPPALSPGSPPEATPGHPPRSAFQPSQALTADALSLQSSREVPADRLAQIRRAAAQAANLELEIQDLEARLADLRSRLHRTLTDEIPALMAQAGCLDFTLRGQGNLPHRRFRVEPWVQASIPASWPESRRREALDALRAHDASWLIKTTVVARFPQHHEAQAQAFLARAQGEGVEVEVREAVHHGQLTKWLRERHKTARPLPPLDVIGGSVGQRAVMTEVDPE